MSNINISRRVFIGASMYLVATPIWASVFNSANALAVFTESGQFFTADELTILTDIAEIMIPRTNQPGATDAHVINVLDGLMLSWAGVETKFRYKSIIKQVEQIALASFKSDYKSVSQSDRESLITELDKRAFADRTSELSISYRKLKEMIFHIFYTSEEANPNFMLVPGTYKGDISKELLDLYNARGRVS
ncbi:twin-arginine translocation pathway signal [Pseudoalteromonas sp. A601]|uniref:gluconate 2-dehydrogenase subunit 3 family protein n=1 Tax=Pseudoalteromonas sp. A601 TaxID=1967839 RepID=UPI000B3D26C7|nr:gluconate 2-dehydrogenase subunit 3 family protein [Pseudoalteromonas sp. A601]OUS71015.1 twin-arginine translocation pathway signal [Pseudoalteromonas sp. A601]